MVYKAWSFFDKTSSNEAQCKHCNVKIKTCGNTSNLRNHITAKHPQFIDELNSPVPPKQPKLDDVIELVNSSKDGTKSKNIEAKLIWFIISDFQAFSIVESKPFHDLIKSAYPLYTIPSRRKLVKLIKELYISKKDLVKIHLKTVNWLTLSTDLWTDRFNCNSYLALTCHYLDDYASTSLCLAVKQLSVSHTADNIEKAIEEIMFDYDIEKEKIVTIICDGAANIQAAAKAILTDPEKNVIRNAIWCVANRLNLIVNDWIHELSAVVELIVKVRSIVKLSKQSNHASDVLFELQERGGKQPLKLLQDVCTRWNSSFKMLDRFLSIKCYVSMMLIKLDKTSMEIPAERTQELNDIRNILGYITILKAWENIEEYQKNIARSKII